MIRGIGWRRKDDWTENVTWYTFPSRQATRQSERKIPVSVNLPDRLSIDKDSPHYDPIYKRVGVRLNGVERDNVFEYCVSEGWARVIAHGDKRDRRGKVLTFKITGTVEPHLMPDTEPEVIVIEGRAS